MIIIVIININFVIINIIIVIITPKSKDTVHRFYYSHTHSSYYIRLIT